MQGAYLKTMLRLDFFWMLFTTSPDCNLISREVQVATSNNDHVELLLKSSENKRDENDLQSSNFAFAHLCSFKSANEDTEKTWMRKTLFANFTGTTSSQP